MESFTFCASRDELVPSTRNELVSLKTSSPHPRSAEYKARSIINDQETRRLQILEEQKRNRAESFNKGRDLIEDIVLSDIPRPQHEEMEWKEVKVQWPRRYRDKLMLSEWMVEVPSELADKWFMVPCPIGKRTLVVATGNKTQAFSKNGFLMDTFPSVLPGGHVPNVGPYKCLTLLDCIWNKTNKTFYILDVLAWNNQPLLECETEFRFYWLKTKLSEMPELSENSTENCYPFVLLPFYDCQPATMEAVMADAQPSGFPVGLDGVLFYHSGTHYTPGQTPLVGWLKPFMIPEMVGVPVAEVHLQGRPDGYEGLLPHIEKEAAKKPRRRRGKRRSQGQAENMESDLLQAEAEMELEGHKGEPIVKEKKKKRKRRKKRRSQEAEEGQAGEMEVTETVSVG